MKDFHTVELEKMDHGTFDAYCIAAWKPARFPWIQPDIHGDVPFTRAHFIEHTRFCLQKTLATAPDMSGQKLTPDRDVLQYIAAEMVFHSMHRTHLRQADPHIAIKNIRNDLLHCVKSKILRTASPVSPLWNKGNKIIQSNGIEAYEIPLSSRWDIDLLQKVAGGHPGNQYDYKSLASFMQLAVPHLATLDRSHVEIYEEEFRKKIWAILSPLTYFNDEARKDVRDVTLERWMSRMDENFFNQIQRIEQEIMALDTNKASPMSIHLLGDSAGQDAASRTSFLSAYKALLGKQTHTKEDLSMLQRWSCGIEYLLVIAAQDENIDEVEELNQLIFETDQYIKLAWNEYPSLAFAQFAAASLATQTTNEKMVRPNDLLNFL